MLSSVYRRFAELIRGPSGRPSSTHEAADEAEGTGGAVSSGSSSSSSSVEVVEKPVPPRTRARTAQSAAGNAPAAGAAAKKRGRRAASEEAQVVCSAPGGSGSGSAKRRPSKKAKVKSKEASGEAGKGESKEQMMQRLCRDFEAMCRGTTCETICLDGNSFRLSKVLACSMRSGAPRTLLRHVPLPHPVLHRQELGAGADSLVFAGECVAGKFQGRAVVVKLQPRHSSTKYQVVFTPCTSNRRWPQKFPWHVCARFCLDVRACVRACALKSAGLSQTVSARCQYR
jgi:hypothetical protein